MRLRLRQSRWNNKKKFAVDSERVAFNKIGIDLWVVINKDNKILFRFVAFYE